MLCKITDKVKENEPERKEQNEAENAKRTRRTGKE